MRLPSAPTPSRVRPASRTALLAPILLLGACLAPGSAPAEDGQPRSAWAPLEPGNADAPRVHYRTAGTGERCLVLVHGWASDASAWRHQFPAWAELGRVLVVDLPGHGESDPPAEPYSMALFADAIVAVLDHAGVEAAVLVGHSNGTPSVVNTWRQHPERVRALVGIDGAMRAMVREEDADAMIAPFLGEDAAQNMARMIAGMPAPGLSEEDREAIRTMALNASREAILGGFEAAVDPAAWGTEPIDVPLLLLHARSPFWTSEYEAFVRTLAPRVDYRVWFDVGHYMQMERPEELREAVEGFLLANGL